MLNYIKKGLAAQLKAEGYDGLCSPDCGCLVSDLAPCGDLSLPCLPGHRVDISATEECGCDGQGRPHWHIVAGKKDQPAQDAVTATPDPLALLVAVHAHLEAEMMRPHPDAPGHCHSVPGRWDADGSPCEWCTTWAKVRECVKQNAGPDRTECLRWIAMMMLLQKQRVTCGGRSKPAWVIHQTLSNPTPEI